MSKKITKKEQLEREYNKQLRRIEKRKKELEQLGYITTDIHIRKKPKRVTEATIRSLKKITPEYIRLHARVVSFETGEIARPKTKASQRIKRENAILASENVTTKKPKEPKKKREPEREKAPSMDEQIISNFLALMSELPLPIYHVIKLTIARQITIKGKGFVAQSLHEMPDGMQNALLLAKTPSDSAIIGFETYLYEFLPINDYEKKIIEETQDLETWDDV